jgi:exopolysaccharide/PEP-CTERM locus tyrosine autokinase
MSVVEKAIRKLQESQASGAAAPPAGTTPAAPNTGGAAASAQPQGEKIVIERGTLRAAGLLPPEADMPMLARQYRKIKQPLIARAVGRGVPRAPKGYLVMIASAMSGEGKTFTAVNLALSMALEKDVKVLLVDADVTKPNLSQVLGLGKAQGLLDVLRQPELDVESLIHPTDLPTLAVLPAGTGAHEATELLASARMGRLTEILGESDKRRIVVFDSAPLLQTTESVALARVVGEVVVVVRAESTPQPVLLDALKVIEGHTSVSLVLNQSVRTADSAYYYYGYGQERPRGGESA